MMALSNTKTGGLEEEAVLTFERSMNGSLSYAAEAH